MDGLGSTLKTVLLFKSLASATQCNSHMQFILGTLAFFVIPLEAIPQLLICVVKRSACCGIGGSRLGIHFNSGILNVDLDFLW